MRLVILESPYAGDVENNVEYARACLRDSLMRDESPLASHLLYTQCGVLNDDEPFERQRGIAAGLAWRRFAHCSVVYYDRGISSGMRQGINAAILQGIWVEPRSLKGAPVPNEFYDALNEARAAREKALHVPACWGAWQP
jgi:hypothetical protein